MLERFSTSAKKAIELARSEAIGLHASQIGCEHLLIGLAHAQAGPAGTDRTAAQALAEAGLDVARLRELLREVAPSSPGAEPLDSDALALVGVDLAEVRRAAEAAFGPGALDHPGARPRHVRQRSRMTDACKSALELALRQAQRSGDPSLTAGHLLIGIIDQGDNGALRQLAAAKVDASALRADTIRLMAVAASA